MKIPDKTSSGPLRIPTEQPSSETYSVRHRRSISVSEDRSNDSSLQPREISASVPASPTERGIVQSSSPSSSSLSCSTSPSCSLIDDMLNHVELHSHLDPADVSVRTILSTILINYSCSNSFQ